MKSIKNRGISNFFWNNKLTIVIVVVIALVIIIYINRAYLFNNSGMRKQPNPIQFSTFKIPSNWKTYQPSSNSFTFSYPPNFVYYEQSETYDFYSNVNPLPGIFVRIGQPFGQSDIQQYQNMYKSLPPKNSLKNAFSLFYSFDKKSNSVKLRDFITATDGDISSTKDITFGQNIHAQEYYWGCSAYCTDIVFRQGSGIFDFKTSSYGSIDSKLFYQIFSTFKFKK